MTTTFPTTPATAGPHALTPRPSAGSHAARATTPWWRLLLRLGLGFKLQYLLDAPATHSWLILTRKYDAFTTDAAYDTTPRSWLGPLGHAAARRVMHYPLHVAMRERLQFVSATLARMVLAHQERHAGPVRVLTAPCGLCRDIRGADALLRGQGAAARRVDWQALDIDARGDVLPEARRRTRAAGMSVQFHREDLLDPRGLAARAATQPVDIVNCIGLTTWLSLAEVAHLARFFQDRALRAGGTLVIDNWARHAQSRAGEDLEIFANYHAPDTFRAALEGTGFIIQQTHTTSNGACTIHVAAAGRARA